MTEYPTSTPLYKKLGIKPGDRILVNGYDGYYADLFDTLPEVIEAEPPIDKESVDFIHMFVHSDEELKGGLKKHLILLKTTGMIWISWPKGKKGGLNRDSIRDYLLQHTGLVDVKVCAVNEKWSGLKFVWRKELRQ